MGHTWMPLKHNRVPRCKVFAVGLLKTLPGGTLLGHGGAGTRQSCPSSMFSGRFFSFAIACFLHLHCGNGRSYGRKGLWDLDKL